MEIFYTIGQILKFPYLYYLNHFTGKCTKTGNIPVIVYVILTKMRILSIISVFIIIIFTGCSIERLAVRSTTGLIENSLVAIEEETDLILAEQSIVSNLKLLEGLLKSDPNNRNLLLLASRGFTSYVLGFVEQDDPARAASLYIRARDYGLRGLRNNREFDRAFDKPFEEFEISLNQIPDRDIPLLFWTANAWAGAIQQNIGDPRSLADLPKIEAMMKVVLERNESFYYAGPHLFFGMILSSKPAMFGGNTRRGREHFERALELTQERFLIIKVFYAESYAVQTLNDELFEKLLNEVIKADLDILPEQSLVNTIAKRRAEALLNEKDSFF